YVMDEFNAYLVGMECALYLCDNGLYKNEASYIAGLITEIGSKLYHKHEVSEARYTSPKFADSQNLWLQTETERYVLHEKYVSPNLKADFGWRDHALGPLEFFVYSAGLLLAASKRDV